MASSVPRGISQLADQDVLEDVVVHVVGELLEEENGKGNGKANNDNKLRQLTRARRSLDALQHI